VEGGCECVIGVDCPEAEVSWGQCQAACQSDFICPSACLDTLDADALAGYQAYVGCLQEHCAGATEATFARCVQEFCEAPYVDWLFNGEMTCGEWFGCLGTCNGNTACGLGCNANLSEAGYASFAGYQGCQLGLCDADSNQEPDSAACATMAFLSCIETGGDCFDPSFATSGLPCADVLECVTDCGGFGPANAPCVQACYALLDEPQLAQLSALTSCVVAACGTTADALTPACIDAAAQEACAAEYAACGGAVAPDEICDNGTDDDGDGLADCDDTDCGESAACAPAPATLVVAISDALDACPAEGGGPSPGADIDAVGLFLEGDQVAYATGAQLLSAEVCGGSEHADPTAATGKMDAAFVSLDGGTLELTFAPGVAEKATAVFIVEVATDGEEAYDVGVGIDGPGAPTVPLGSASGTSTFLVDLF
jgi:hypothetical protein